jgi:hypothetical protein
MAYQGGGYAAPADFGDRELSRLIVGTRKQRHRGRFRVRQLGHLRRRQPNVDLCRANSVLFHELVLVYDISYGSHLTNQANRPRADGAPAPPASDPVERGVGRQCPDSATSSRSGSARKLRLTVCCIRSFIWQMDACGERRQSRTSPDHTPAANTGCPWPATTPVAAGDPPWPTP